LPGYKKMAHQSSKQLAITLLYKSMKASEFG
jgi:hypothetical protein